MAASRRTSKGRTRRGRASASGAGRKRSRRYWSGEVTEHSDAMDLERGVFRRGPREMARSVERSAESSRRRKSSPFRAAMSMLTFFENRAGKNLSPERRRAIEAAKRELRRIFGREKRKR